MQVYFSHDYEKSSHMFAQNLSWSMFFFLNRSSFKNVVLSYYYDYLGKLDKKGLFEILGIGFL